MTPAEIEELDRLRTAELDRLRNADLHAATYLLNCLPTKTLAFAIPFFALHGSHPSYTLVFPCATRG